MAARQMGRVCLYTLALTDKLSQRPGSSAHHHADREIAICHRRCFTIVPICALKQQEPNAITVHTANTS